VGEATEPVGSSIWRWKNPGFSKATHGGRKGSGEKFSWIQIVVMRKGDSRNLRVRGGTFPGREKKKSLTGGVKGVRPSGGGRQELSRASGPPEVGGRILRRRICRSMGLRFNVVENRSKLPTTGIGKERSPKKIVLGWGRGENFPIFGTDSSY